MYGKLHLLLLDLFGLSFKSVFTSDLFSVETLVAATALTVKGTVETRIIVWHVLLASVYAVHELEFMNLVALGVYHFCWKLSVEPSAAEANCTSGWI